MTRLTVLDDQPANSDQLHFKRYLNAIESTVLKREETTPLVVGIFGAWGSGKSTLLGMLENKLNSEQSTDKEPSKWILVKFSPWLYAQEKSLLLPLLATLAKALPARKRWFQAIVKYVPGLSQSVLQPGSELFKQIVDGVAATTTIATGLPLMTFLNSILTENDKAKDLQEKIAEAVKSATGEKKRMVFLIDDLDRCHDPVQIVGLLEQLKLFLHLDQCLFFIAADREQIVKAIHHKFPGTGDAYLEKFIQLAFDLPTPQPQDLVNVLDIPTEQRQAFTSLGEVLGCNPRKLKRIWNEAVFMIAVLKEEMQRVQGFIHEPSLDLALKWLLLKQCGKLSHNPYPYLAFEKIPSDSPSMSGHRNDFIQLLQCKDSQRNWHSEYHRRLAVFLWNDRLRACFRDPRVLSLYAHASGEDHRYNKKRLEDACFEGGEKAEFSDQDFNDIGFWSGHFHGAVFIRCQFTRADFCNADLSKVKFIDCDLRFACFDHAKLEYTQWQNCGGLDDLATEPERYETIANAAVKTWQETKHNANWNQDAKESLYKAYKTILNLHENQLSDESKTRLTESGLKIRAEIVATK